MDEPIATSENDPAASDDGTQEEKGMPQTGTTTRIALWIGLAVLGLALGATAVILITSSGSSNSAEDQKVMALSRPPAEGKYEYVDALVTNASDSRMQLMTTGNKSVEFFIRAPDRSLIDVQHAQSHAALGQPVRVYWKEIDGKKSIVYLEDAPAVFR